MQKTTFVSTADLPILDSDIARLAGGHKYKLSAATKTIANSMSILAKDLATPTFTYAIYEADAVQDDLRYIFDISNSPCLRSLTPQKIEKVAFCLCSMGPKLDTKVQELYAQSLHIEGLFFNAAALAALDNLARIAYEDISQFAGKHGIFTSGRLEPGCENIPFELQKNIFNRLDSSSIGVVLTDDYIMQPFKSLSFIVPITASASRFHNEISCQACSLKNCLYRKIDSLAKN